MKKNSGRGTRFQHRRTVRLTAAEDKKLTRQAATASISVSEYMRRQTIRELRRLGGLLKHHFDVVKRTGNAGTLAELDAALSAIRRSIEALSEK